MKKIAPVIEAMSKYYHGEPKRINHFLKVYAFAKTIGEQEGLDEVSQEILEVAAVTHDIGIKNSEIKYGSGMGTYQQIEGPPEAEAMLSELGYDTALIERVCWLIAHHHTYKDVETMDHQILLEADYLVNSFEQSDSPEAIGNFAAKVFRTVSGRRLLTALFPEIE